jgi:hypothetical protein
VALGSPKGCRRHADVHICSGGACGKATCDRLVLRFTGPLTKGLLRLPGLAIVAVVGNAALLKQFDAMSATSRVTFLLVLLLITASFGANVEQLLQAR